MSGENTRRLGESDVLWTKNLAPETPLYLPNVRLARKIPAGVAFTVLVLKHRVTKSGWRDCFIQSISVGREEAHISLTTLPMNEYAMEGSRELKENGIQLDGPTVGLGTIIQVQENDLHIQKSKFRNLELPF
ncbi:hypothetical protein HY041_01465 [Candidatus Roizmanbacteria bacterium]|nr:hypothetical protein [Candidatus Roizmanbacteria bacterium]